MKKSRWIFLLFFLLIGPLAVQSVLAEGQIQKRRILLKKPKLVQVRRWINLFHPQHKISGTIKIALNGTPLSNWKVKAGGHAMNYSASYYNLSQNSFSVQSGKVVRVVMTPPPGFWLVPQALPTRRTRASSPIIASARICRISKFTYPANKTLVRLGRLTGNLTVTWISGAPTYAFRLYERNPNGSFRKLMDKQGVSTSVAIPKRLLRPKRAYKMTLVQVCGAFKFNRKMAPNSFIDLMINIDSHFVTAL